MAHKGFGNAPDSKEIAKLKELLEVLPPDQVANTIAAMWMLQIKQEGLSEQVARAINMIVREGEDVFIAVARLLGLSFLCPIPTLNWRALQKDAVFIISKPNMFKALSYWDNDLIEMNPLSYFFANFTGLVHRAMPQRLKKFHENGLVQEKDCQYTAIQFAILNDYFGTMADVAGLRVHFKTDDLMLHYRRPDPDNNNFGELCLSFIQDDGFTSFFPLDRGKKIKPSSIKRMKKFVSSYKGPEFHGPLSPHKDSRDLCEAIGLKIKGDKGFLVSNQS
jgi:hypothetical protein